MVVDWVGRRTCSGIADGVLLLYRWRASGRNDEENVDLHFLRERLKRIQRTYLHYRGSFLHGHPTPGPHHMQGMGRHGRAIAPRSTDVALCSSRRLKAEQKIRLKKMSSPAWISH